MECQVASATAQDIDLVGPLWKSMVEHHQALMGETWPARHLDEAWRLRRQQYLDWLHAGVASLFIGSEPGSSEALGYAVLRVQPPGPTWDLGEEIGILESLAVLPGRRGSGVGSALLAACRGTLAAQGIRYWCVMVVEANTAAARLYERAGFRPFYRDMVGLVAEADRPMPPPSTR